MSKLGFCVAAEISFSTRAARSASRASIITVSPVFASSRTIAFPSPDVTPVTIYTLFMLYLSCILHHERRTYRESRSNFYLLTLCEQPWQVANNLCG